MSDAAPLRTRLYDWHKAHGGRMVDFAGWSMPVQYSTIIDEHRAVRERVGLFDISHMGRLLFNGPAAAAWIDRVTTNNVARLVPGQIQYSLMVDDEGGVLDDILVYRKADEHPEYLVVCNASNRLKVVDQFERHHGPSVADLRDRTLDSGMIAVQGPAALDLLRVVLESESPLDSVGYYRTFNTKVAAPDGTTLCVAVASRTGYTGEDGFELIVFAHDTEPVWARLLDAGRSFGIQPCGLGARDTLRFEAAMPLYGHEMDETVNPYAAGLGWAVKLNKGDFVGREALRKLKANPGRTRVGLALEGKRIARQGCSVSFDGREVGVVTSGTFSPTLDRSLAMALVAPEASKVGTKLAVDVRGNAEPAEVVSLPFYRREPSSTGA